MEFLKLPGLGSDPDLLPGRVPGTFYFSKIYSILSDFPKIGHFYGPSQEKNLNPLKISDEIVKALFFIEHFSKILNVWLTKMR